MQNTTDWSHQITGDPVGFSQHYGYAAVTFGWIRSEFGVSNKEAWIHPDFMSLLVVWWCFTLLWALYHPLSINISISISLYNPSVRIKYTKPDSS